MPSIRRITTNLFGSYDFTPELTGRINDSTVWNKNHALIDLPRFISDGQGGTTQLTYRVVETGISWDGGSPDHRYGDRGQQGQLEV